MKRLISLFLAVLVAACASTGPRYERPLPAPDGYATVVFMREPGLAGAARPHSYYIDKTLVARLSTRGYTFVYVKPGTRELHYGGTPEYRGLLITVQAVAGETYYFKEGRSFGSIIPLPGVTYASQIDKVNLLGRDQAESELTTYGYQKPEVQSVD